MKKPQKKSNPSRSSTPVLASALLASALLGTAPSGALASPAAKKPHPQLKATAKRFIKAEQGGLEARQPGLSARQELFGASSRHTPAGGGTVIKTVSFKGSSVWSRLALRLGFTKPKQMTWRPSDEPSRLTNVITRVPGSYESSEIYEVSEGGSLIANSFVKGGIEGRQQMTREDRSEGPVQPVYFERLSRLSRFDARAPVVKRQVTRHPRSGAIQVRSSLTTDLAKHGARLYYERSENEHGNNAEHMFSLQFNSEGWRPSALSVRLNQAGDVSVNSWLFHASHASKRFEDISDADRTDMATELISMIANSKSITPADKARLSGAVIRGVAAQLQEHNRQPAVD